MRYGHKTLYDKIFVVSMDLGSSNVLTITIHYKRKQLYAIYESKFFSRPYHVNSLLH